MLGIAACKCNFTELQALNACHSKFDNIGFVATQKMPIAKPQQRQRFGQSPSTGNIRAKKIIPQFSKSHAQAGASPTDHVLRLAPPRSKMNTSKSQSGCMYNEKEAITLYCAASTVRMHAMDIGSRLKVPVT